MEVDIFNNIIKQFSENINSHVFLFNTNNKEKCLESIKKMITKIIDADEVTTNQIINEIYIELFIVKNEANEIKSDQISFLLDKIKIKPVLSKYLFYIITDAEKLNVYASNKLLKTIEEPNKEVVGFIITDNINKILPTIKSRCEILDIIYKVDSEGKNEHYNEACKIIEYLETKELIDINLYRIKNLGIIDNYKDILNNIINIYSSIFTNKKEEFNEITKIIINNNSEKEIMKKALYLNNINNLISSNMNKELLFDKIFIDFRGMNE